MQRMLLMLTLALAALPALALPQPTTAQSRERCFAQTGYCVAGAILNYWERNGGLPVFGYPITALRTETIEGTWSGPVQWFERDRLEDHGAQGVLAGRLGARVLEQTGRPWTSFDQVSSAPPGCAYFAVTRHSLCEPFLSYWTSHGGLERFGYPITEPFTEGIGAWSGAVQYFERRRMEHHLEHRGTLYEVLLGRLGSDVLGAETRPICTGQVIEDLRTSFERAGGGLGCPAEAYRTIPAAVQSFERGYMIWIDLGGAGKQIYAIFLVREPGPNGRPPPPPYAVFDDTWTPDQPASGGEAAPPGLYEPQRGFGKVWRAEVRELLGWATEPERAEWATFQRFEHGGLLWILGTDTIYVFGTFPKTNLSTFPRP